MLGEGWVLAEKKEEMKMGNLSGEKMWAFFMKLGSNMWGKPNQKEGFMTPEISYHETMYCEREVWRKVTEFLPQCGINTLLIDMGEGVKLDSHPELAIPGSWEKKEFREELKRLRELGLTPLPKYNFSCGHNAWLQDYGFMVGTETYDRVCRDIVEEAIDLFDKPAFLHLGLEEETAGQQKNFPVTVVRSPQKKTEDALALFDICLKEGVRPWIWLDPHTLGSYGGEEAFRRNIPQETLISNWYYGGIEPDKPSEWVQMYDRVNTWGYEQVPTCSTWSSQWNTQQTLRYCKDRLEDDRLRGFLTAAWMFTTSDYYYGLLNDAWTFRKARNMVYPEKTV